MVSQTDKLHEGEESTGHIVFWIIFSPAQGTTFPFFLSLYTTRPSFEYYQQVYTTGSLFPAQGTSSYFNAPIRRTAHLFSVIPANDRNESMFGHRNFPCRERGSILGPLLGSSIRGNCDNHSRFLFDSILYVPSFSYKGTGLPGLNKY